MRSSSVNCVPVWYKYRTHFFLLQLICFSWLYVFVCVSMGECVYIYICIYEYCKCCFYVFLSGWPALEWERTRCVITAVDAFYKANNDLTCSRYDKLCWSPLFTQGKARGRIITCQLHANAVFSHKIQLNKSYEGKVCSSLSMWFWYTMRQNGGF